MNGEQTLQIIGKLAVVKMYYESQGRLTVAPNEYYQSQIAETESLIRDLQASFINQRTLRVQWSEAQARTFDAHNGQVGHGAMALNGNSDHNCPSCGQALTHRRESGFSRLWCEFKTCPDNQMKDGVIGLDELDAIHDLRIIAQGESV